MNRDNWTKLNEIYHSALEREGAERAEYITSECGDDTDLKEEVLSLLKSAETNTGFLNSSAIDVVSRSASAGVELIGNSIGSYRLVSEIGRGGMGTVYLAERADAEFDHQVALKLIKRGMDTDEIVRRFKYERQILASLSHDNIGRLLDGGTTNDGLSYFVMEYIDGLSINKFADENELTVDERLSLFRRVCSAVAYAHKSLVVHRDLKPSNILVKSDGVPKLLDFGIAKVLSPDNPEDATLTGMKIEAFTPRYASPEQIRGEHLTTATDIYSLGKILIELLASKSKTPAASPDFAQDPDTNKFDVDLATITAKATHDEMERRYSTVERFSEDIRRYQAGLPVSARPDSLGYRAGKFFRRHRLSVSAGALVLLSVIGGLTISIWQTSIARRQEQIAERRFDQVREIARTVLFDYHDRVAELPGSTELREQMVKDSLKYLDALSGEGSNERGLQLEIAQAFDKVGDVQGNPYHANLGDAKGALDSYQKAHVIRTELLVSDDSNVEVLRGLMISREKLGDIWWNLAEHDVAIENYRKGRQLFDRLTKMGKATDNDTVLVAMIEHKMGTTLLSYGRSPEALAAFREGYSYFEALQNSQEVEQQFVKFRMAISRFKIGDSQYDREDFKRALANYEMAKEGFSQESRAGNTENVKTQRMYALAVSRVADALSALDRLREARSSIEEALSVQRRISAADPQNVQIRSEVSSSLGLKGRILAKIGLVTLALDSLGEAISIGDELIRSNPKWEDIKGDLSVSYLARGETLFGLGKNAEAAKDLRRVNELLDTKALRAEQRKVFAKAGSLLMELRKKT